MRINSNSQNLRAVSFEPEAQDGALQKGQGADPANNLLKFMEDLLKPVERSSRDRVQDVASIQNLQQSRRAEPVRWNDGFDPVSALAGNDRTRSLEGAVFDQGELKASRRDASRGVPEIRNNLVAEQVRQARDAQGVHDTVENTAASSRSEQRSYYADAFEDRARKGLVIDPAALAQKTLPALQAA